MLRLAAAQGARGLLCRPCSASADALPHNPGRCGRPPASRRAGRPRLRHAQPARSRRPRGSRVPRGAGRRGRHRLHLQLGAHNVIIKTADGCYARLPTGRRLRVYHAASRARRRGQHGRFGDAFLAGFVAGHFQNQDPGTACATGSPAAPPTPSATAPGCSTPTRSTLCLRPPRSTRSAPSPPPELRGPPRRLHRCADEPRSSFSRPGLLLYRYRVTAGGLARNVTTQQRLAVGEDLASLGPRLPCLSCPGVLLNRRAPRCSILSRCLRHDPSTTRRQASQAPPPQGARAFRLLGRTQPLTGDGHGSRDRAR